MHSMTPYAVTRLVRILVRGLTCTSVAAFASIAASPACAGSAKGGFKVNVELLAGSVQIVSSRGSVVLTPADAASHKLAIPDVLTLRAPGNVGYSLRFDITDPKVNAVDVSGLGTPLTVRAGGAVAFVGPAGGPQLLQRTLSYTVDYVEGVRSGMRPMPLRATFVP